MRKSIIMALVAALFAIACIGPAIAADASNSSGVVVADTENYTTPAVYVPAVANDSQHLPENCNQEVKAIGAVRITQNGDQVKVNGSGGRGNLGHKYDSSNWCMVVLGTHHAGDTIALSYGEQKSDDRPTPGMKIVQIAAISSDRIR